MKSFATINFRLLYMCRALSLLLPFFLALVLPFWFLVFFLSFFGSFLPFFLSYFRFLSFVLFHNEKRTPSEVSAARLARRPAFGAIIDTDMKTNMNSIKKAGAERGERSEAREAHHL